MSEIIIRKLFRVAVYAVLFILVACTELTPPATHYTLTAQIDRYVEELVQLNEVPGLALAVIQDGEIIYENYFGVTALDTQKPVTKDTVFRIYSTSKLMTAVAIFDLIEQDKLTLDAPISDYFNGLPEDWNDVTIGHLLAHASGLPDVRDLIDELTDEDLSDDDFFKLIFPLERQYPTGEDWSYTQTNYLLLKRILEQVTGESFEDYLRAQAFPRIGTNRTIFSSNDSEDIPQRAKNYRYNIEAGVYDRKLENWGRRNNVLAGLNLTLGELINWSQDFDAGKFISPATRATMWTPFDYKNSDEKFLYGWGVYPVSDQISYGFTGGGVSALRKFPNHDITIIVLSNGFKYYSVHNTVINHVAGMVDSALNLKPVALARMYQHEFLKTKTLDIEALYAQTIQEHADLNAEEVMTSFGYKLMDIREPEHALKVFEKTARRNPESFNALENLGHMQLSQGDTTNALVSFKAALQLDPENIDIKKIIGKLQN